MGSEKSIETSKLKWKEKYELLCAKNAVEALDKNEKGCWGLISWYRCSTMLPIWLSLDFGSKTAPNNGLVGNMVL